MSSFTTDLSFTTSAFGVFRIEYETKTSSSLIDASKRQQYKHMYNKPDFNETCSHLCDQRCYKVLSQYPITEIKAEEASHLFQHDNQLLVYSHFFRLMVLHWINPCIFWSTFLTENSSRMRRDPESCFSPLCLHRYSNQMLGLVLHPLMVRSSKRVCDDSQSYHEYPGENRKISSQYS